MTPQSPAIDMAEALARGLAAHLRRWATDRGAPADSTEAVATAAIISAAAAAGRILADSG